MRTTLGLAAGALAVAALLPSPALADVHQDEDLGFQVAVPRGWKRIPLPVDEEYIVAKYLCDRSYTSKDGYSHTPDMRVIYFSPRRLQKPKVEARVGEDGSTVTIEGLAGRKAYKDYVDYLKDNSYGGYYVAKEEKVRINGIDADWIEVKFEKLTTPRRGLAVVFHRDVGADYAVQFEVLEEQWDKLNRDFGAVLRTFKFTAPKKDLAGGTATGPGTKPPDGPEAGTDPSKPKEKDPDTPESRRRRRDALYEKELAHARSTLSKGWKEARSRNFTAFTHVDDKYTKRVLDQAEAVRAWLEKTFDEIGDGLPGPVIIRICESADEERSFRDASSGSGWGRGVSLTTHKDLSAGSQSSEFQWVNRFVMRYWFAEKAPDMTAAMPYWVEGGLDQFVMTAVLKGGRIDFKPDTWELELLRNSSRSGKIASPKALVHAANEDYQRIENALAQTGAFVRFLLDGPGAADRRTRGKLIEYMKNLGAYVREREKEAKEKEGKEEEPEAATEEEEEERFRKRQQEWKKRERELLEEVAKRTFDLDDAGWAAVDRLWRKTVE